MENVKTHKSKAKTVIVLTVLKNRGDKLLIMACNIVTLIFVLLATFCLIMASASLVQPTRKSMRINVSLLNVLVTKLSTKTDHVPNVRKQTMFQLQEDLAQINIHAFMTHVSLNLKN